MIVNACEMLNKAYSNKYAVPHFNINNLEWTRIILETCDSLNEDIILGVSEGAIKYMGGYDTVSHLVYNLVKELNIKNNVSLHLDHGSSFDSCKKAIDAGFSSVMIDASKYSLEENIKITKEVVDYAHDKGVSVEAEIGHIGGTEDGVTAGILIAKTDECIKFVNETGVDFLAPALGTAHGLYSGPVKLDFIRMKEINEALNMPLVMHGGSGVNDELIRKSIKNGISKININTELQVAWAKAVRKYLDNNKEVYDPRKIIMSGENAMKEVITKKLNLFRG